MQPNIPNIPNIPNLHAAHGGGGIIFSVGLMRVLGGEVGRKLVMDFERCPSGGDCLLSRVLFANGWVGDGRTDVDG